MIDGFDVAIHRSLTEPVLLGGAPRSAAIAIGTLAAAFTFGLQLWLPGIALWIILHTGAVYAAKADPDFMAVTARHLSQKKFLSC